MRELRNWQGGNRVDDGQTRWTDELQMMMSHRVAQVNRTNKSHKQIAQNMETSCPRMEMTNDALGCSRATQVHMEYLRLLI